LSRRLLASYLSIALVVLALLEVPLAISFARNEHQDLEARVERDAVAIASFAVELLEAGSGADQNLAALAERYASDTGGRVVIVDARGVAQVDTDPPVAGQRRFLTRPEFASALSGRVASGTRESQTLGQTLLYVAVPAASGGVVHGAVRISYPTSVIEARTQRYWLMLGAVALIVLALVALVGLALAATVSKPIKALGRAATAAGSGDLTTRAPLGGPPEVREVGERFNEMVARLEDLVSSQQAFVADASHQLRTPLAALHLRLENLEGKVTSEGSEGLAAALAETERLDRMVNGLLVLARADRGPAVPEDVDLASIVDDRARTWAMVGESSGVDVVSRVSPELSVRATPGSLDQVLDNLLDNALKVSPAGTTVHVDAKRNRGVVEIAVVDAGPGMTAEERARAFDRFWQARTNESGSGLGLAIVRRLARADGGDVELREAPGGGLQAVVTLPASERVREPLGAARPSRATARS
jgi:signal transduction histidine kinase